MKDLIDALIAIYSALIGDSSFSAKSVIKGFDTSEPDQIPIQKYPFLMIDDGGERVEEIDSPDTQHRIYGVAMFIGYISGSPSKSLDGILQLNNETKTILELEANRQYNGHVWAVTSNPVAGELDNNKFFRGREIVTEFIQLEDREYYPY